MKMNKITGVAGVLIAVLVLITLSCQSEPESVSFSELEHRGGLFYVKGENVPFTGAAVIYYPGGPMHMQKFFQDGLNVRTVHYDHQAIKRMERHYDRFGSLRKKITWDEDGKKDEEQNYNENQKLHGHWSKWYPNGKMQFIYLYTDGRRDGKCFTFYENGDLESETNYRNGKKDGVATWWNDDGKVRSKKLYDDDKEVK